MDTLAFLLFCLAIGYVLVWVIVSERRGDARGSWGLLAMRDATPVEKVSGRGRSG
jgi:hypothetical protein